MTIKLGTVRISAYPLAALGACVLALSTGCTSQPAPVAASDTAFPSLPCLLSGESTSTATEPASAIPHYVLDAGIVTGDNRLYSRAEAEAAGESCLALYTKERENLRASKAWVLAAVEFHESGQQTLTAQTDPYAQSGYADILERGEYFPTAAELKAAKYPEPYIQAFAAWEAAAPATVREASDKNRAAARDTQWQSHYSPGNG